MRWSRSKDRCHFLEPWLSFEPVRYLLLHTGARRCSTVVTEEPVAEEQVNQRSYGRLWDEITRRLPISVTGTSLIRTISSSYKRLVVSVWCRWEIVYCVYDLLSSPLSSRLLGLVGIAVMKTSDSGNQSSPIPPWTKTHTAAISSSRCSARE